MSNYQKLLDSVNGFLSGANRDMLTENANKEAKNVTTHRDLLAGILSKHLVLEEWMPPHLAELHKEGVLHFHDADYAISNLTNCCLPNYPDMLENGWRVGDAQIESPQSIGVASTVLTQIVQAVACSQYGGQSLAHIDRYLAPYVARSYAKLKQKQEQYNLPEEYVEAELRKEVKDAMQAMLYQINSLCTTNGQAAFVSISFGLDTSRFGRMITEEYLKVHMEGLGKDKTVPVFPKVLFFLEDGVNLKESDPNYDLKKLSIKCSSLCMYPDYISVPKMKEQSGIAQDALTVMGCRSALGLWVNEQGEEQTLGRFNAGVVSLNLPLIALQAQKNIDEFNILLDTYMEAAYDVHMWRVDRLKETKAGHNPVMFMYGAIARLEADETIEKLLFGGRTSISIGFAGLYETVEFLVGKEDKGLALSILKEMKNKCAEFKARSDMAFSLYASPSESTAYKFATTIHKQYGKEVLEGRDYVTNGFHLPVWKKVSPIEKWQYEEGFNMFATGGAISYIEQPSLKNNLKAYEMFVDYAYNHLAYFAINTPVDKCLECKYEGEFLATQEGFKCPCCGNTNPATINVLRRVSGYLTSPNARPFNKGKQQECIEREKHS